MNEVPGEFAQDKVAVTKLFPFPEEWNHAVLPPPHNELTCVPADGLDQMSPASVFMKKPRKELVEDRRIVLCESRVTLNPVESVDTPLPWLGGPQRSVPHAYASDRVSFVAKSKNVNIYHFILHELWGW